MLRPYLPVILSLILLLCASEALAVVELAWSGRRPHRIEEVYNQQGVVYLPIDEVLRTLGMSGDWRSVDHRYVFSTPAGKASLFPGGHYLEIEGRFIPLENPARFIDGRLRIGEDFVVDQLPELVGRPIYFRNLDPVDSELEQSDNPIDQLFALLLKRKSGQKSSSLKVVGIDVGHGGEDVGTIGLKGTKEKDVVLELGRQLEKQLKMQLGLEVYLSRDGDYSLSPEARLKALLQHQPDVLLLLHAQGHFSSAPAGIELFVRPVEEMSARQARDEQSRGSRRLAEEVRTSLEEAGFSVNDIAEAPLLPLGRGDLPTLLIEAGYLTNPDDVAVLTDADAREEFARALLEGLKRFSREPRSRQ
ncbi:MAG: hypothetical protein Tsb0017_16880 [Geothermobacteraceae bacterium]